jgi:hypothetical protein
MEAILSSETHVTSTKLYAVTTQKIVLFIVTAVRPSSPPQSLVQTYIMPLRVETLEMLYVVKRLAKIRMAGHQFRVKWRDFLFAARSEQLYGPLRL